MEKLKGNIVIGKKQVLRFIDKEQVFCVYVAKDADSHVTDEIIELCGQKSISPIYLESMKELGKACGIDVNAAAAAVLK